MNNVWIDIKFANILSPRLPQFKVKKTNPYLANFRCPLCGDSEKNKLKARGYIYQKDTKILFKCHNCGTTSSFSFFLKKIDGTLFEEYNREVFLNKEKKPEVKDKIVTIERPKFLSGNSPLRNLQKISQLHWNHPAKQYVVQRKIPNEYQSKLFFCEDFAAWTNSIIPEKLDTSKKESRLIIPFLDEDKNMFGYQGRSFNPKSNLKYITIMLEDKPKIYGLDTVNKNFPIYIFEGPIDSMFIPNSIAMAGADVKLDSTFKDVIYIFDNEPRNKSIVKRIDNAIKIGYKVVIWDETFPQKDINDMILAGNDAEHIKIILDKRTFSGIQATLELTKWKKCNV